MSQWIAPNDPILIGYDAAGTGPPVVLIHAFPLDRTMWRAQAAQLAGRFQVITPDVFGFGESRLPECGWTVDSMADALASFVSGIGVEQPIALGGLSMGGYIALAFARRHPERLRALILADTRAEPDTPEGQANREKTMALAREKGPAAVFEEMLPKMLTERTRTERPELVAEVRRIAAAQSTDSVVAALTALRDRPDATPGLAAIRVPTLVLVGADDLITPPDAARTLAASIRGAKLEVLPDAAHLSNLETFEPFTSRMRSFLDSLS